VTLMKQFFHLPDGLLHGLRIGLVRKIFWFNDLHKPIGNRRYGQLTVGATFGPACEGFFDRWRAPRGESPSLAP